MVDIAPPPVFTVSKTGGTKPTYDECLAWFVAQFRRIYGDDCNLDADTQDGEFLAIMALALDESNAAAASVFNAFSPATAQGEGLSRVVKTNGIRRKTPSKSSVDLLIVGQVGATILGGIAGDDLGSRWLLPASVTIPVEGQIIVTATSTEEGGIAAVAGSITQIVTPTIGWQTVTNPNAASPGAPVEQDAALRLRQAKSTEIPSQSLFEGTWGSLLSLDGVADVRGYENDSQTINTLGLPAHSVAFVVDGGDDAQIAEVIRIRKGGAGTHGNSAVVVTDTYGVARTIRFSRPVSVPTSAVATVRAKQGYTAAVETQIRAAMAARFNENGIGNGFELTDAYLPARLYGAVDCKKFELLSVAIARDGATPTQADIAVAFNERLASSVESISIVVAP